MRGKPASHIGSTRRDRITMASGGKLGNRRVTRPLASLVAHAAQAVSPVLNPIQTSTWLWGQPGQDAETPNDSNPVSGWVWAGVLVLLLGLEGALLHLVAAVGVAPYYPRWFDQVQYLTESYRAYDALRERGIVEGMVNSLAEPRVQGWLLQLEAALVFLVTGPARLPALDLNIVHFLAFLAISAEIARRALGAWCAITLLSLVLSARGVTNLIGAVWDFRLDFAAMCLWGALVTVLAFQGPVLAKWKWTVAVIVLGEMLICTRTIAFVYVVGTVAALVVCAPYALGSAGRTDAGVIRRRLSLAIACWAATEAGFVVHNLDLIVGYYIGGHVLGGENQVRAAEAGVTDVASSLGFYARSLVWDQLGPVSLAVFLMVAGALAVLAVTNPRQHVGPQNRRPLGSRADLRWPSFVLGISLGVPYAAFTLDPSKSGVVAGILLPPFLLALTLGLAVLERRSGVSRSATPRGMLTIASCALVLASAAQASGIVRRSSDLLHPTDVALASQFIQDLAEASGAEGGRHVVWESDAHMDFAPSLVVRVYYYELHRQWLDVAGGLGDGPLASTLSAAQAREQAAASQVLILSRRTTAPRPIFPYDLSIEAVEPVLVDLANQQYELRAHSEFFGRNVYGYVQPTP
jgi:hypothetical protein